MDSALRPSPPATLPPVAGEFAVQAGRICLGVAAAGSGLMQVVNAAFVRLMPETPAWLPEPPVWAVATGVALIVIGAAIATGWRMRPAALALIVLLSAPLLLRVWAALGNPWTGFMWTNPSKTLAFAGGAFLLATGTSCARVIAAWLLGVFLVICGVQHVIYADFVDTLVPGWIPPGRRFWTLCTAATLLAGGAGLLWPRMWRLAGLLSGIMIFLWVLLLHIPRSVEMRSAFELAGAFEALGMGGVAWLVAAGARPEPTAK